MNRGIDGFLVRYGRLRRFFCCVGGILPSLLRLLNNTVVFVKGRLEAFLLGGKRFKVFVSLFGFTEPAPAMLVFFRSCDLLFRFGKLFFKLYLLGDCFGVGFGLLLLPCTSA